MDRPNQYYTEVRTANRAIWEGINSLLAHQHEHTALDYTNTLPDGTGTNEGYNKDEVTAVVFATANAMAALLQEGHATNMAKLL